MTTGRPDPGGELQALAASSSVLVVGAVSELAAGELIGPGQPFDVEPELLPGPPGSHDAIVVVDPRPADRLPEALRSVRSRLREKGRVVITDRPGALDPRRRSRRGCPGALDPRRVVLDLSEAGFAVLEPQRAAPPSGRYVGRKDRFFVRAYQEGDEHQIVPMFQRRFHVRRGLPRWTWLYRENPYGALNVSEAFTEDGTLAAHYAGYPVEFDLVRGGPRTLRGLQVGDTMTEAHLQPFGAGSNRLLPRTVRHFYARFCEERVAFNYGFNTGKIQRFSMRLASARRLEDVPFHALDPGRAPLRVPGRIRSLFAGYRVERVTAFDVRWDELYARVRDAYGLLVRRDARYLQWRYASCPDVEYFAYAVSHRGELVGWGVFRTMQQRLVWGDALFDPRRPEALRQLLAHVRAAPAHRDATTIVTWATARPAWWREWVTALGFERRPEPDDLAFVFVPFEFDPEDDFRAQLYYTMGDSDLF